MDMATDTVSTSRIVEPGLSVWQKDFDRAAEAVLPYVLEDGEGSKYISEDCPASLRSLYSELTSVGYFYGYLRA